MSDSGSRLIGRLTRGALVLSLGVMALSAGAGALIDLTAEASRPASNDLLRSTVFVEATDGNPSDLARRINADLAQGLKLAKTRPAVSVKSGSQHSSPIYGQNRRIENWRMRAELQLESRDAAALTELLAALQQQKFGVASLQQLPAPETRRQVEDETTRDALKAFEARAGLVASSLGKPYQIRKLSIQQSGGSYPIPMPLARTAALSMEAAPMPLETGTTLLSTQIQGQIELGD